jgi:hypothetical protein
VLKAAEQLAVQLVRAVPAAQPARADPAVPPACPAAVQAVQAARPVLPARAKEKAADLSGSAFSTKAAHSCNGMCCLCHSLPDFWQSFEKALNGSLALHQFQVQG